MPSEYSYILDELLPHNRTRTTTSWSTTAKLSTPCCVWRKGMTLSSRCQPDQTLGGGPSAHRRRHLRPRGATGRHPQYADGPSLVGHRMGQPRHFVDGCCLRQSGVHRCCGAQLPVLQQHLGAGAGLWHQPAPAGAVCRKDVRRGGPKQGSQKAISIILFKLEGQIIRRNPEYQMEDRLLLDKGGL